MHVRRPILAALLVLPCALLLSCLGESGSSLSGVDPQGFWGGCMRPDDSTVAGGFYDGDEHRVFITFSVVGDPKEGGFVGDVVHPDVSQLREPVTRKGCPAKDFQFAADFDGLTLAGVYNGSQRTENWEVQIEFSPDGETATGTYEITLSEHTYFDLTKTIPGEGVQPADGGPLCLGLTGTIELVRSQVINDEQDPPFDSCPGATADLR